MLVRKGMGRRRACRRGKHVCALQTWGVVVAIFSRTGGNYEGAREAEILLKAEDQSTEM